MLAILFQEKTKKKCSFSQKMPKKMLAQIEKGLPGGGGTLGISGWGCAARTLEPLTYTRASSAEFCYPLLE